MSTYREIVYYCLDSIKAINGDSNITEEHVLYLANSYRHVLIELKKLKLGQSSLTSASEQTICIDLEKVSEPDGMSYCNNIYLRSILEVPQIDNFTAKLNIDGITLSNLSFVSKERFPYVGNNQYMKNIIYGTLNTDNHIYLTSMNPQFKYLKKVKLTGVFQDSLKAVELSCDESGNKCDIMDAEFPLDADLIPQLLEIITKELLGINYRPADNTNNNVDDLSDIIAWARSNMKSNFQKLIEG